MVGYALVRTEDGGHFFAGQGGHEGLTLPARELLGERMDAVLDEARPYTLCTRIEEGWNECAGAGRLPEIIAYVGPTRRLEPWLLDQGATVLAPIQQLGTIDLRASEEVPQGGAAVVVVSLGGTAEDRPREAAGEWYQSLRKSGIVICGKVVLPGVGQW